MKILCVVPTYWPAFQFGGPIFSVHTLNQALARNGIEVTVFTTDSGQSSEIYPDQMSILDHVPVTYFRCNKPGSGWFYSSSLRAAIQDRIKNYDLCYIVGVWSYPLIPAAKACLEHGIPYVISPRGHLYPETFRKRRWKKWPYFRVIIKGLFKRASAIHYTSKDEAESSSKYLGLENRDFVVPNPVEIPPANYNAKVDLISRYPQLQNGQIILFLGRINWKKGLELLIKAFSLAAVERPDLRLLIAGSGSEKYLDQLRILANKNGVLWLENELSTNPDQPCITYAGMLSDRAKWDALMGSDVFVLPSFSENFGMSVAEAMGAGLPVIVTDKVALHSEVLRYGAGIVIEPQPMQIAAAIRTIVNSDSDRSKMGANGKRAASVYAPDHVALEMIEKFKSFLPAAS